MLDTLDSIPAQPQSLVLPGRLSWSQGINPNLAVYSQVKTHTHTHTRARARVFTRCDRHHTPSTKCNSECDHWRKLMYMIRRGANADHINANVEQSFPQPGDHWTLPIRTTLSIHGISKCTQTLHVTSKTLEELMNKKSPWRTDDTLNPSKNRTSTSVTPIHCVCNVYYHFRFRWRTSEPVHPCIAGRTSPADRSDRFPLALGAVGTVTGPPIRHSLSQSCTVCHTHSHTQLVVAERSGHTPALVVWSYRGVVGTPTLSTLRHTHSMARCPRTHAQRRTHKHRYIFRYIYLQRCAHP